MSLFENELVICADELQIELRPTIWIEWADFILNPRRLRGSDFLMRWSQGVWSEDRIIQAINETETYFALPYGPSGTAPDNDVREFELYFERLEAAGLGRLKRPDLLIFRKDREETIKEIVEEIGGIQELPFTPENDSRIMMILSEALIAVECENSLWRAKQMPDYGSELRPQKRLNGELGLKKSAVLPTVILKEEDRFPLLDWQNEHGVRIHIWHAFFDLAFGIALNTVEELISRGKIEPIQQVFQAPGGATTKKVIYKVYYHYAYSLGEMQSEPKLVADQITDRNGHILPYVKFEGGTLAISPDALQVLSRL